MLSRVEHEKSFITADSCRLKVHGYTSMLFYYFYKERQLLCDFTFASPVANALKQGVYHEKLAPITKGDKVKKGGVASLESVPTHLNYTTSTNIIYSR